uniref:Uncharacterized protein n=1 Tax=Bacillus subtilis TaxID=1423 RepID=Q45556_BACIU|nr:14-kd DNA-entry nuclease (gtg start codon) [Bacillus subtilis]
MCTIDRDGAEERREQSLKDVPSKKGYDRDEWPMAMCKEGGEGASVEYISPLTTAEQALGSGIGLPITQTAQRFYSQFSKQYIEEEQHIDQIMEAARTFDFISSIYCISKGFYTSCNGLD